MKIVSVILARGGSKGIKNKNIINLNGKPLIYYSIIQSLLSESQETYVSTNGKKIKKISLECGAKVLDRPKKYALDNSPSEEALLHFAENIDFSILVFIQPTSPLIKFEYINKGIDMIKSGNYDSIFSCYKQHFIPEWSLDLKPLNFKGSKYPRRQDKECKLLDIGMFYVLKKEILLKNKFRLGGKIGYVEIPLFDSFQIDDYCDLKLVEKLIK